LGRGANRRRKSQSPGDDRGNAARIGQRGRVVDHSQALTVPVRLELQTESNPISERTVNIIGGQGLLNGEGVIPRSTTQARLNLQGRLPALLAQSTGDRYRKTPNINGSSA